MTKGITPRDYSLLLKPCPLSSLGLLHSLQHGNSRIRVPVTIRIQPERFCHRAPTVTNEVPQNADFPQHYSRKEKKPFPVPIVELRRAARERMKKMKDEPRKSMSAPKNGLLVKSLVLTAYNVYNTRITLINNLKKLLKVVPVHACGWCNEIHVGPVGHPFELCKGTHANIRKGLHEWTNAHVEDILIPIEAYHLFDRLGKWITHEERFSGVEIPEFPTKRRRKPIIRIGRKEFIDADESDLPDKISEGPLKPLPAETPDSEIVAPLDNEVVPLAVETILAWERTRKGAKRLMRLYNVSVCGYCPEIHQSVILDDLIPPRFVWHVPDVNEPLERELRNFYGQAPE
ncbi:hypothetical protein AAZX31_06G206400 [Glycine max]